MNCIVCPSYTEASVGVTAIHTSVGAGAVTVKASAGLVTPLNDAVILVVPAAKAVANPLEAEIVAFEESLEDQVTDVVMS